MVVVEVVGNSSSVVVGKVNEVSISAMIISICFGSNYSSKPLPWTAVGSGPL